MRKKHEDTLPARVCPESGECLESAGCPESSVCLESNVFQSMAPGT